MNYNKDFNNFLIKTAEIGENFNFIQGAGGNTSFKNKNSLFIKASGFKLKQATEKNIFVEVNLQKLKNNIQENKSDPLQGTWDEKNGLKPSIETYMHAIFPHRYVFHIHCLNTISWLVQSEFKSQISPIFKNLKYSVVRYAKPGIELSKEIQKYLDQFLPNILFLKNHGLVIGSDNINEVLELIYFVSNKLNRKEKINSSLNQNLLKKISQDTNFRPTKFSKANQIAASKRNINISTFGTLFPDQVIFLGLNPFKLVNIKEVKDIIMSYSISSKLPIIIVPNSGVLVPKNIKHESEELLLALNLIILKIPDNIKLNYLNKNEEIALINSDDEKYRQKLNNINKCN